jgi:3-keto-5-aminohexanoate cleavage enzyme
MHVIEEDRVIINAAITGCVLTKKDTPFLPVTLDEIVDCARRVRDAGASIVHLHARNPDQTPCYDSAVYTELVGKVREACGDVVVCVSLSGRHIQDIDRRSAALASRPDMASLTLGSVNFPSQANVNDPDSIHRLAKGIYGAGAVPELEAFEPGFIDYAKLLVGKGILRSPLYFNFIFSSLGEAPVDLAGLSHMVGLLPPGSVWAAGRIGKHQLDVNVAALAAGGHVRVGVEDNLYYDRLKTELADNVRLVRRIALIAREMGREPAEPALVRRALGLSIHRDQD